MFFIPHAISFWNIIPGSLLPLFSNMASDTRVPPFCEKKKNKKYIFFLSRAADAPSLS